MVLGRTGLQVSRVGFGGYRVDDETIGHRQALELALDQGCNLIDTSTNYTDGGSERMIGAVLAERMARRSSPHAVIRWWWCPRSDTSRASNHRLAL